MGSLRIYVFLTEVLLTFVKHLLILRTFFPDLSKIITFATEAREKITHKFVVKNYAAQMGTFEVESDLVHISGPSSIQVYMGIYYNFTDFDFKTTLEFQTKH